MKQLIIEGKPVKFKSFKLEYRIEYLNDDLSNAWQFLLVSLVNFTYNNREKVLSLKEKTHEDILVFIEKMNFNFSSRDLEVINFSEAYKYAEKKEIEKNITNNKVKKLKEFLDKNSVLWLNFARLVYQRESLHHHNEYESFKTFALDRLYTKSVNYYQLEIDIEKLFWKVEEFQMKEFLFPGRYTKEQVTKELNIEFNFNNHKRPLLLEVYPEDMSKYKNLLKAWLHKEIIIRQRSLGFHLDSLPMAYQVVFDYAENLLDPGEKRFLQQKKSKSEPFPAHIFPSIESYKLIDYYAKNKASQKTITFVFRWLQKTNNPKYHIEVSPAGFMQWFNSHYPDREYLEIKDGYEKSYATEREVNINIIISLLALQYT